MSRKRKKKNNKKNYTFILILILILIIAILFIYYQYQNRINIEKSHQDTIDNISSHYSNYVITNKESKLYVFANNEYNEFGKIGKDQTLKLDTTKINYDTKYFKISSLDEEYYIAYQDVNKIDELEEYSNRYKEYIPFNQNVITNDITNLYDEEDNLIYTFNKSLDFPIIIKDTNKYGIEYQNRLLYIKKEDVKEVIEHKNTDKSNTKSIGALNYHFFWDDESEKSSSCNQIICHSKTEFQKQLNYIKENNILTLKMNEVEMYIDNKIQLPNSVVITIDDGWRRQLGMKLLTENKMYGTVFLVTGDYDADKNIGEYIEFHSHTHNMHKAGVCSGGQGGGIKCLPKETILNDLKASREELNNSTVLCYPFYEYNNYSIGIVKEAGFTMAFAGETGNCRIYVGANKLVLPRFVVSTYTTMNEFANYLKN